MTSESRGDAKHPGGRPSSFTQSIADAICERLIGGESLRTICQDAGMPGKSTVCRWLAQNEEFRDQYARAREMQADVLADETLDIADDGQNDWMEKYGRDGESIGWQVNGEAIGRSKLRVEARRWYAGKLAPKKYGDKVTQEISGPDGKPIEHTHTVSAATRGLLEGLSRVGADRSAEASRTD